MAAARRREFERPRLTAPRLSSVVIERIAQESLVDPCRCARHEQERNQKRQRKDPLDPLAHCTHTCTSKRPLPEFLCELPGDETRPSNSQEDEWPARTEQKATARKWRSQHNITSKYMLWHAKPCQVWWRASPCSLAVRPETAARDD
eukprot:589468-Prymnesium_polylepis.4